MSLRWPDVEGALVIYLAGVLGVPVYTETKGVMPPRYVIVARVGGSGEWIDRNVDVEIVVSTTVSRPDMWDLAGDVESAMWDLAANQAGDVYVDDVRVAFGFAYDPPDAQTVRQAAATFTLTVRPTRPA